MISVIKKLEAMSSAIKNNYTDDMIIQLELQIKQIQQLIISLSELEKTETSTSKKAEPNKDVEKAVQIIRSFKI